MTTGLPTGSILGGAQRGNLFDGPDVAGGVRRAATSTAQAVSTANVASGATGAQAQVAPANSSQTRKKKNSGKQAVITGTGEEQNTYTPALGGTP